MVLRLMGHQQRLLGHRVQQQQDEQRRLQLCLLLSLALQRWALCCLERICMASKPVLSILQPSMTMPASSGPQENQLNAVQHRLPMTGLRLDAKHAPHTLGHMHSPHSRLLS